MKRRFFWLVALAGLVWLYLRRGARRPQPVDHAQPAADPADELRRKLDETKDRAADESDSHLAMPEPVEVESPQTDPPERSAPAPSASEELDTRRREIHERARLAADEMHGTSSDD